MVVDWGLLTSYQKQHSGNSAPFSRLLLLGASVPPELSGTGTLVGSLGSLGAGLANPDKILKLARSGFYISSLCLFSWSSLHYILPELLKEGFYTTNFPLPTTVGLPTIEDLLRPLRLGTMPGPIFAESLYSTNVKLSQRDYHLSSSLTRNLVLSFLLTRKCLIGPFPQSWNLFPCPSLLG